MKDLHEKKCGCVVFTVGPPVLCEKHRSVQEKKLAREQAREEKGLRKLVADQARDHGHDLSRFKEYPSYPGKWTAHCHDCGSIAIVYDKAPAYGDQINAKAILEHCQRSALVGILGDADREAIAERLAREPTASSELPVPVHADA